jgi:hypothetical protein
MDETRPHFIYSETTTVRDFLIEALKMAMERQGMRFHATTTYGGCVFHYTVAITEIDIAHTATDPETKH